VSEMSPPVGRLDLVLDQLIDGLGIRHPQQGLGQAHQPDTLRSGQPVLGEKALQHRGLGLGAHPLHELCPGGGDGLPGCRIQPQALQQVAQDVGLRLVEASSYPLSSIGMSGPSGHRVRSHNPTDTGSQRTQGQVSQPNIPPSRLRTARLTVM
jgi:hypothetical protein